MKKKQYFLFAALLLGSAGALVASATPFSNAKISNSRTIKFANTTTMPIYDKGDLNSDVTCEVTEITKVHGNAKVSLYLATTEREDGVFADYCFTTLDYTNHTEGSEDPLQGVEYNLARLEYQLVDKQTGDIVFGYSDIQQNETASAWDFNVIGANKFNLTRIATDVVIHYDDTKYDLVIEDGSFNILNFYPVITDDKKGYVIDPNKIEKTYCSAEVTSDTKVNDIDNFIKISYKGRSTFNGVGSISFGIKNNIKPSPEIFYISHLDDIISENLEFAQEQKVKGEIYLAAHGGDKTKLTEEEKKEYRTFTSNEKSYKAIAATYKGYRSEAIAGNYEIRTSLKFSASSKLNIYFKDGTTAQIPLGESTLDLTHGSSELCFFDKKLNRDDIVCVSPTRLEIKQRLFNHTRDSNGHLINSYVDPKDDNINLGIEFLDNNLALSDTTFISDLGEDIAFNTTNKNPSYVDSNKLVGYLTLGTIILYEIISVVTFFILKKKNKDDIFKRVRPKVYWKTNTVGLFTVTSLLLMILSISLRSTVINNTFEVTNTMDILIVTFSIASIILVGYFIRYFAIQIKNIFDKRRNEKLKINSNSIDDGTLILTKPEEGDKK